MTGGNMPYITAANVKRIDDKIDDGLASSGKIIAYCLSCGANSCTDDTHFATSANYALSNPNDTACRIQYELE